MGKITFRADDDLVDELEAFDASKSEVMRAALREYLESHVEGGNGGNRRSGRASPGQPSIDDVLIERVDELVEARLAEQSLSDVTVSVSLDRERKTPATRGEAQSTPGEGDRPARDPDDDRECRQCGESLEDDHVYCPNCGEKTANRLFCECGDEVRSDWSFCPGCGRRTPAADVLDSG